MKTCNECGKSKELVEFSKDKTRKDGLQRRCKQCKKAYNAGYNKANKTTLAKKKALYQAEHRNTIAERKAKYRTDNRELVATQKALYYQKHKDTIAEYRDKWNAENPEYHANYRASSVGKKAQIRARAEYKKKYPGKIQARQILADAVRHEKIGKPATCSVCFTEVDRPKLHAHHAKYSEPLNVQWLCSACHVLIHKQAI